MKRKIYAPFFFGLGLALASMNGYAKPTHHSVKKHNASSAKRSKHVSRKTTVNSVASLSRLRAHGQDVIETTKGNGNYPVVLNRVRPFSIESSSNGVESGAFSGGRLRSVIIPDKHINFSQPTESLESSAHLSSLNGVVETTFAEAAEKAGLAKEMVLELTRIFAWDVDFAFNLKPGDQFTIIYKSGDNLGGERKPEQIIAAEVLTRGNIFTAVRYKDQNGFANYYSPEGKSLHKAFLRSPVDFARISSHYSSHRKHPVLNRIRAHKGVDYAARTGTPVKSAGDGVVSFLGRKGGYGQVLMIKHGDHYETLYAHLSGFKRGLRNGTTVRQGEVIGYVGQTGLATGPHLHYEFRIDGEHKNPESLSLDHSMPLAPQQMADFNSQTRPLLAQLYRIKASSLLARNSGNGASQ